MTDELSPLAKAVQMHARAGFSGMWIQTVEPHVAVGELCDLASAAKCPSWYWDLDRGVMPMLDLQTLRGVSSSVDAGFKAKTALEVVQQFPSLVNSLWMELAPAAAKEEVETEEEAEAEEEAANHCFLWLEGVHRPEFMERHSQLIQALHNAIILGKQEAFTIGVLAPVTNLPVELERLFVILDHALPNRSLLHGIATDLSQPEERPKDNAEWSLLLDASAGLTTLEAENAMALSIATKGKLDAKVVRDYKHQSLRKSGLLELYEGGDTFADLGGLEPLKEFCFSSLRCDSKNPLVRPKGIMLLGPPGTGKSQFAKALGNEMGWPTVILDLGSLMGSLVGQTEANLRQALKVIESIGKCVVFLDEIERAVAGSAGAGKNDSGVMARAMGTLLTWLNDNASGAYVVCTCNDITSLPEAFSRAERFDGIFFNDLPGREEKDLIWKLYLDKFELAGADIPPDDKWTGAEIRSACRLAALLKLPLQEAARQVVPVATTAAESVVRLREWASGRCRSANRSGLYFPCDEEPARESSSRRAISRKKVKA